MTSILLDWPCLKLGEVGSGEEADGPAVSYVKTAKEAAKAAKAGRVHILASIDSKQIDISCHKYFLIGAARGAGWNVWSHCQSCGGFEIQCWRDRANARSCGPSQWSGEFQSQGGRAMGHKRMLAADGWTAAIDRWRWQRQPWKVHQHWRATSTYRDEPRIHLRLHQFGTSVGWHSVPNGRAGIMKCSELWMHACHHDIRRRSKKYTYCCQGLQKMRTLGHSALFSEVSGICLNILAMCEECDWCFKFDVQDSRIGQFGSIWYVLVRDTIASLQI